MIELTYDVFAPPLSLEFFMPDSRPSPRQVLKCSRKLSFRSAAKANHKRIELESRGSQKMRPYECDICGNFHLATKLTITKA